MRIDRRGRGRRHPEHVRGEHRFVLLLAAVQRVLAWRGDQADPIAAGLPHEEQRGVLQPGGGNLVRHQRAGVYQRGQRRPRQHGIRPVRRVLLRQHLAGQHLVQQRRRGHVRGQFQRGRRPAEHPVQQYRGRLPSHRPHRHAQSAGSAEVDGRGVAAQVRRAPLPGPAALRPREEVPRHGRPVHLRLRRRHQHAQPDRRERLHRP